MVLCGRLGSLSGLRYDAAGLSARVGLDSFPTAGQNLLLFQQPCRHGA